MLAAVSTSYFLFLRFYVMDEAGDWWFPTMYKELWADGERGFRSVIKTLLTNPLFVIDKIVIEKKIIYLAHLFTPLASLPRVAIVEGRTDDVLHASDVVLTASGTATVQTALHERPMVILYKLSPLTYRLGRPFVKVDTFGMANLIAGRRVVPELIQDDCTPERVAGEALALLTDRARADTMRGDLRDVRQKLGEPGASRRAAAAVLAAANGNKLR